MHEQVYRQLAEVEDRLWWHEYRRSLIRLFLRGASLPKSASALDVGCGTGGSLGLLAEFASRVVGIDRSPLAIELAKKKCAEADLRIADAAQLAEVFQPASFDLITILNVLYHRWIPREVDLLKQVFRLLKPRGCVLITDAAFPCLFRKHDRIAMGTRRFRMPELRQKLGDAGFVGSAGTYFNMGMFPALWLSARWDGLRRWQIAEGDINELAEPPKWIHHTLRLWASLEQKAIRILGRLPLGASLICLAHKPGGETVRAESRTRHVAGPFVPSGAALG